MNIQRKKIIDKGNEKPFTIKEISTDKKEIKAVVNHLSNEILETYIRDYTIPTIDAFNSDNVTWELDDQIVYVTNEIVKCDNCND